MRAGRCGAMADGAVVRTLSTILTILTVFACAHGRQPSFQGLGDLPGGEYWSEAVDVSAEGNVVVGTSTSDRGDEAFRWTEAEGMGPLAPPGSTLPNGWRATKATGVSADGSVIVGNWYKADGASPTGHINQPFRWTEGEGIASLPGMPPDSLWVGATGISGDGRAVAIFAYSGLAFRWTASTGLLSLTDENRGVWVDTHGITADGSVVVGRGWPPAKGGSEWEAWRWTLEEGIQGLGDLPGGYYQSTAKGVSADGTVIVGYALGDSGMQAFAWNESQGMVPLGVLAEGSFGSSAFDVSADGTTIVGYSESARGFDAFIWDPTHGMRALRDVLTDECRVDLDGWTLRRATAVSDDGQVIVGYGINPDGEREAWVAVVPEPGASALLLLVFCGTAVKRRSK